MAQTTTIRNQPGSKLDLVVGQYSTYLLEDRDRRAIIHPVTKAGVVKSLPYQPLTTEERGKIFNAANEKKP